MSKFCVGPLVKKLLLFILFFGLDRFSKIWVLKGFYNFDLTSFLSFDITMNRGIAWGLLHTDNQYGFWCITGLIVITICAMVYNSWSAKGQNRFSLPELLIFAGATSNLTDRLVYQGVIDFISVHFGNWAFPVFNLADVWIVTGVFCLMLGYYEK